MAETKSKSHSQVFGKNTARQWILCTIITAKEKQATSYSRELKRTVGSLQFIKITWDLRLMGRQFYVGIKVQHFLG